MRKFVKERELIQVSNANLQETARLVRSLGSERNFHASPKEMTFPIELDSFLLKRVV